MNWELFILSKFFFSKIVLLILFFSPVIFVYARTPIFVENMTKDGRTCTSKAYYTFMGRNSVVWSGGSSYCLSSQFYTMDTDKENFNLYYFQYKNGSSLEIDESCKNKSIIGTGYTLTLYIRAIPSNILSSNSRIICDIEKGPPKH